MTRTDAPAGASPAPAPAAVHATVRVLAVVRALNEQATVGTVVRDIARALPHADILVVDDGSTDGTASAARDAGATVMSSPVTQGMCRAVQHGYRAARDGGYDALVQIDGDGQHRAADAVPLLAELRDGPASLVVGSRFLEGGGGDRSSTSRRLGNRLLSRAIARLTGLPITDATSGLRAADRHAIAVFAREYPGDEVEAESLLVAWRHGLGVAEVPVVMRPRAVGRSTITAGRSAVYAWRVARGLAGVVAVRRPRAPRLLRRA